MRETFFFLDSHSADRPFQSFHTVPRDFRFIALQMIMAKVLVGEFIRGDKTMVVPPKIPGSERHYDTTSNSNHAPALIVSDRTVSFDSNETNACTTYVTVQSIFVHYPLRLVAPPAFVQQMCVELEL